MIKKKAQGLPLNIIIIAAIVLIVLVILVIVFKSKIGKFGSGLDEQTKNVGKECEIPGTSRECVRSISDCSARIVAGDYADCESRLGSDYVCCEF